MLQLLGRDSSINVRKVLWLLVELGLPVQHHGEWAGERSTQDPEFLALNPNGLVPVLIDGDYVLWESNSICRYLCEREGRSDLLPRDPKARGHVEQWMDWCATNLNSAWRYAFMRRVRKSEAFNDPMAVERSVRDWNRHMQMLEDQLAISAATAQAAGQPPEACGHALPQGFTLADVLLGLAVQRWIMTPMTSAERPRLPRVRAYYDRLNEREGFRRYGRNGVP